MRRREFLVSGTAALGASLVGGLNGCKHVSTQSGRVATRSWPRQPVTIVVPFDAGGSADRLARGFAQFMPKYLGEPMIVVDHAGASGMIGTTWFLQQPADGYTVMLMPATPFIPMTIILYNAPYRLDDFTFVNAQWTDYSILLVPKTRPWHTAAELIDDIRRNPGKLSTGVDFGSVGDIEALALLDALGLPSNAVRFVTFAGSGALHTSVAGGQVDFYVGQADADELIRDYVRPLAVFLDKPVKGVDAPPINDVLKAYNTSVPILSGSVRSFVFPAAFEANHPDEYATFVSAYRATLNDPAFKKWLRLNQMQGNWVGEERTTQIIRDSYEALKKYKSLL